MANIYDKSHSKQNILNCTNDKKVTHYEQHYIQNDIDLERLI